MARICYHFVASRSPHDDAIQHLTFEGSVNSITGALGLDLVSIFKFTLRPIGIPNVSACKRIVVVNQYAHVALRVVKHRRVPVPGNKAHVLQVPRERCLPLLPR